MLELLIKNTLPLVDIVIDIKHMNDGEKKEYTETLGNKPLVYFNGIHISEGDIKTLNINSFNFSPTIEMKFIDSSGLMDDKKYPLDNSIISVFMDSKSDVYKEIRLDFKILSFDILKFSSRGSTFTLKGTLNCDYLFLQDNTALSNMTSFSAIKQIAKDSGLGLVSNITDSNDSMTWINPYLTGAEFIQDITKRSYIKDESFMWVYVDLYNNINYIDVESVLENEVKKDNVVPLNYLSGDKELNSSFVLTNDKSVQSSNTYFNAMQIINRSTEISIESGYRRRVHMYDISGNWDEKAGEFLIFDLDSINTPGSENNMIIMKSSVTGEDFYKNNIYHEYLGKFDKDNVHLDYLYAKSQNIHNINNLQKIALKLVLPTPNYAIARYQKINVVFSNQGTGIASSHINNRLSGEWIVIGIGFDYSSKRGGKLQQILTLVRRELSPDSVI